MKQYPIIAGITAVVLVIAVLFVAMTKEEPEESPANISVSEVPYSDTVESGSEGDNDLEQEVQTPPEVEQEVSVEQ